MQPPPAAVSAGAVAGMGVSSHLAAGNTQTTPSSEGSWGSSNSLVAATAATPDSVTMGPGKSEKEGTSRGMGARISSQATFSSASSSSAAALAAPGAAGADTTPKSHDTMQAHASAATTTTQLLNRLPHISAGRHAEGGAGAAIVGGSARAAPSSIPASPYCQPGSQPLPELLAASGAAAAASGGAPAPSTLAQLQQLQQGAAGRALLALAQLPQTSQPKALMDALAQLCGQPAATAAVTGGPGGLEGAAAVTATADRGEEGSSDSNDVRDVPRKGHGSTRPAAPGHASRHSQAVTAEAQEADPLLALPATQAQLSAAQLPLPGMPPMPQMQGTAAPAPAGPTDVNALLSQLLAAGAPAAQAPNPLVVGLPQGGLTPSVAAALAALPGAFGLPPQLHAAAAAAGGWPGAFNPALNPMFNASQSTAPPIGPGSAAFNASLPLHASLAGLAAQAGVAAATAGGRFPMQQPQPQPADAAMIQAAAAARLFAASAAAGGPAGGSNPKLQQQQVCAPGAFGPSTLPTLLSVHPVTFASIKLNCDVLPRI